MDDITNNLNRVNSEEPSRKYEAKIKNLISSLDTLQFEGGNHSQKKVEDDIIDLEKTIDEECMTRIIKTHQINIKMIGKLKDMRYDFNQEKPIQCYDSLRNSAVSALLALNTNLN